MVLYEGLKCSSGDNPLHLRSIFFLQWFASFLSALSNDVNLTSPYRNPLVAEEIDWTDRMVSDFKKYEDDVKEVFPVCGLYNLTTIAMSTLGTFFYYYFIRSTSLQKIFNPLSISKFSCRLISHW